MNKGRRPDIVYWMTFIAALLSLLGVGVLAVAEVSVRWTMNRDFTFMGSDSFLGLCILALGLTLGLIYSQRS